MSTSIKLGFFLFFFLSLTVLLLPGVYETSADFTLRQAGIYQSIQDWDQNFLVSTISGTTNDVIGSIRDLLGDEEFAEEAVVSETFFEDNLYPVLLNTVTVILRIALGTISFLAMIGSIYLSFATSTVSEVQVLRDRCSQLEERISSIEEGYSNLGNH